MLFVLPPEFGEMVNEIGRLLRSYEASVDQDEKDQFLREAMVACCDLLRSLNLSMLELRIGHIINDATMQVPGWKQKIIGDPDHFDQFLNHVEEGILKAAKVDEPTRRSILGELARVRMFTLSQGASPTGSEIVLAITELKQDVCKLKDEQIRMDSQAKRDMDRRKRRKHVVRTLGVVAVAANGAGALLFPMASVAGLAASGILGAAVVTLTEGDM